jgi:transcription factor C subunit 7
VLTRISKQFRSNWTTDNNGNYSATITSPTGIPSDPPLAAYGVAQARELADYAAGLDPKIERIYSSPFYRCLETINPLAEKLDLHILCDNGIGEWYGTARFGTPLWNVWK